MGEELAKWVLLAYGLFMTTLVAGVVYGWQSFRAVFIAEGVLSEGCDADSADGECPSQAKELGLIFACGACPCRRAGWSRASSGIDTAPESASSG